MKPEHVNTCLSRSTKRGPSISCLSYGYIQRVLILLIFFVVSAPVIIYGADSTKVVNGLVISQSNEPISGASISVKPGTAGSSTNENGRFAVLIQNETDSIEVSSVGYVTQTVVVGSRRDITFVMVPVVRSEEEIVTVAFGQRRKTELVGSQTVVNPTDLKIPSSNLTSAFAGRIAGMIAFQQSGEPGNDNANFFIRGVTTFGYKKDPLILIDNIEVSTTELARLQTDDIASFSIMKDATATALYGSRAANGVILIKTKEGREDKVSWNMRVENSFSSNTKNVELADPITYMRLENESVLTRDPLGALVYQQNKIDNTIAGTNPYVFPANDWREMLVKKVTNNQRANLNVNGGGKVARYYISGSYNIDNGILNVDKRNNFNNNIKLNTYQLRSNVNINLTKLMDVTLRLGGLFDDYTGPMDGGHTTFIKIMGSNPVLFPAYFPAEDIPTAKNILFGNNSQGIGGTTGVPSPRFINPYADLVRGYRDYNTSRMFAQFEARHDLGFITSGLSTRFLFNTSRYSYFSVSRYYNPFYYEASFYNNVDDTYELVPLNRTTGTNYLSYNETGKDINTETYYELALDYVKTIEDHQLTALLVGTRRNRLLANQGSLQRSLPYRNQGVSGRLTYAFDNRYIAEFNFGYNGSERFHKSHRYGFFPSVGLAYNISREKFWDGVRPVVNDFKLRATYGLTGNDAIGTAEDRFFYLSTVNMNDANHGRHFGTYYNYWLPGITITRYANEEITWETARKTNIGFDARLLNSLNVIFDVFTEYRDNILMDRAYIPRTMGLSAPIRANVGKAVSSPFFSATSC